MENTNQLTFTVSFPDTSRIPERLQADAKESGCTVEKVIALRLVDWYQLVGQREAEPDQGVSDEAGDVPTLGKGLTDEDMDMMFGDPD